MLPTDETLFEQWSSGNKRAGQALVGRYFPYLSAFFRSKLSASIDDLVQQTFLISLERSGKYRKDGPFKAFLFGTARILLLQHLRRRAREHAYLDVDELELGAPELEDESSHLAVAPKIAVALEHVPDEFREVLVLAFYRGLSAPEIASQVGLPLNTVYSRLRRAKQKLRRACESLEEASPEQSASVSPHPLLQS